MMYQLRTINRIRNTATGSGIIYFLITPGKIWVTTKIKCASKHWDDAIFIKKSHPQYMQLHPLMAQYQSRAEQFISNLNLDAKAFDKRLFTDYIFRGPAAAGNPDLLELVEEYMKMRPVGMSRTKQFWGLKNDLKNCGLPHRLLDVNYRYVQQLRHYWSGNGNNGNTIIRKIKQLKALVHYAQLAGLLNTDPLAGVKLSEIKGSKVYLLPEELSALEELYQKGNLSGITLNVLRLFLLSCYTSLRHSDIVSLDRAHIQTDHISIIQEKTDKPVVIPLIPKAMALLNTAGPLFQTYSNQVCNRYLKQIALAAGFQKKITYHVSRHTFATLSIFWGIPYEVVADIMGIDMRTARVYAKVMDRVKFEQMKKWG